MSNRLPNEWLGLKGECRFQELCAEAMLAANKSGNDVMGWDFIVEVPDSPSETGLLLDQRRAGPTCRIQVKTVWKSDEIRAEMTLSAAERLAKPAEPAFVCILVVAEDLAVVEASLVHIAGDNLARILKRLRQAEAGLKPNPLNKQKVTFTTLDGERFTPTGENLRNALLSACGSDSKLYRDRKEEELEKLGYELGRYQLKVELQVGSTDEIVEMALGLRPVTVLSALTTTSASKYPSQ